MKEIQNIYRIYSDKNIKILTILNILFKSIVPTISILFLEHTLNYIKIRSSLTNVIIIAISYIFVSFSVAFFDQLLMTKVGEYRLSYLVTEYFNIVIDLPIEKRTNEYETTVSNGELFSAHSWKG